jgi:hypothetical protein
MKKRSLRSAKEVEALVAEIATMRLDALRRTWEEHRGVPPPGQSTEILRRRLAWELQAHVYGGLSAETKRKLKQLHDRFTRDPGYTPSPILDLKPGTVLEREWRGTRHRVHVVHSGFDYAGRRYGSLSEIARTITGQRWSGPLFFGLKGQGGRR